MERLDLHMGVDQYSLQPPNDLGYVVSPFCGDMCFAFFGFPDGPPTLGPFAPVRTPLLGP